MTFSNCVLQPVMRHPAGVIPELLPGKTPGMHQETVLPAALVLLLGTIGMPLGEMHHLGMVPQGTVPQGMFRPGTPRHHSDVLTRLLQLGEGLDGRCPEALG